MMSEIAQMPGEIGQNSQKNTQTIFPKFYHSYFPSWILKKNWVVSIDF